MGFLTRKYSARDLMADIREDTRWEFDITNSDFAYLGYRYSIAEPFTKLEMFDDGLHNDGAAGDGTYGTSIDVGAANFQYYVYADNDEAGIFSPQRAEHEYHELAVTGDLVINEFLASNSSIQTDQDGEYNDWIELYNNSANAIDLSGYYLSDDGGELTKWAFLDGTSIAPGDYLIVWADDDEEQTGLHANFKLSASGETVFLSDASGSVLDEVVFPVQTTDVSYGRYPNGTGTFRSMPSTYSAENLIESDPTGIYDHEMLKNITIYPNPVQDYFTVDFDTNKELLLVVYNSIGQIIHREVVVNGIVINTSGWSNGVYVVKIDNKNCGKIVKN